MKASAAGVAWYRREDYARLLTIFEDADKLPVTYDKWLAIAETGFQAMERSGVLAVKVIIDPDEFPKWCAANGHKINAEARMEFASVTALKELRGRN